ncbi:hypothetical protein SAMN05444141_109303 [Pseudovibrio denitrificans]|uniref:Uncharacterized protein n=1 Tax=Pseudovibrio denitrificans TaxID=258256 RepID=A0A1I7DPT4_9HYPH|nr:hypothetical protein [Pseudovibrio denitrificans]SFU13699.1 hypothetical protein SAMN05444141_109303 [Pseudovibrio denitrificans]
MSAIQLSSFVEAAQNHNGLDKLHTTSEAVTERTSHTSVGGKVLSWAKLHITGDSQKSADQARFQEALKAEFGEEIAQFAYNACTQEGSRSHSLTKAQVLDTVEFALRTQEEKTEARNTTAQTDILTSVTKAHGAEVASDLSKLLEGSSEFAKAGENPEQLKASVTEIAKDIAKQLAATTDASIASHIEQMADRDFLKATASNAGIQIDWDQVSPEQISNLQENVQGKLETQSRPDNSNQSIRSSLKDDKVQAALANQLRAIEALQSASAGGALLEQVFAELGLPAEKVSQGAFGLIATVVNGDFKTASGPEGTNDITGQIEGIARKAITNCAVQGVLASTLNEVAQTEEFSTQIAPFVPEGTEKEVRAAQKWLPTLVAKEIVRSIKEGNSFEEQGGIINAGKAELRAQIEAAQGVNETIKSFVEHLTADEINAELLTAFTAKHSQNAEGLGGDDNKFAAERHFTKIFKEHPEVQQQLNTAFASERLKNNAQTVSEAIELISRNVEEQLVNRLQQAGKHPTEAYATASEISSTLKGPFVQLFAPLLDSISAPDEELISQDEFLEQKQAVANTFFFPNEPSESAAEVANGLVKNFHSLFEKHNLQLSF